MSNPSSSKLKLIRGWGSDLENPSEHEITEALRDMDGGENSFVILQKDTDNFIQVAGHEEAGFLLEYWEDTRGHYCTASDHSLDSA